MIWYDMILMKKYIIYTNEDNEGNYDYDVYWKEKLLWLLILKKWPYIEERKIVTDLSNIYEILLIVKIEEEWLILLIWKMICHWKWWWLLLVLYDREEAIVLW